MFKTRQKIKKIVDEYKKTLFGLGIRAERVILFGSFAKGNPKQGSDIDLVVISNDFKKLNLRERLEVLGVAAVRIMKPIEAKGYTLKEIQNASPASFLQEVLMTGVRI